MCPVGNFGDDSIQALSGRDVIDGGSGDDVVNGEFDADLVTGAAAPASTGSTARRVSTAARTARSW